MRSALAVLVVLVTTSWPAHAREAGELALKVLQNKEWLVESRLCPATLMPRPETAQGIAKNKCKPGKLGVCLNKCGAGNASACYWLVNELQQDH